MSSTTNALKSLKRCYINDPTHTDAHAHNKQEAVKYQEETKFSTETYIQIERLVTFWFPCSYLIGKLQLRVNRGQVVFDEMVHVIVGNRGFGHVDTAA